MNFVKPIHNVLLALFLLFCTKISFGQRSTILVENAERIAEAASIYDNELLDNKLPPFASLVFNRATWTSKEGETETEFLLRHVGITPSAAGEKPLPTRRRLSQEVFEDGEPKQKEKTTDTKHVLDFGYGSGHMTRLLRKSLNIEHQVHGIEISRVQAARATAETVKTPLMSGIAYGTHLGYGNLPYRNNYFHHVLSQQAFSHCPDRKATFAEVFRVLQPGGQLAFQDIFLSRSNHAVLHAEPVNAVLGSVMGTISEYKKELKAAGFADIQIESIHDLAKNIDVQRHLTQNTSAGAFKPSKPKEKHPELVELNIDSARVRYGDIAVANALVHNALGIAIFKARKPLK